jgi:hypothetical protein
MSDSVVQPLAEPVPQPTPGLSQIQRVMYTFTAPSKTFNDIKAGHKSWWLPFLLTLFVSYLFFAVVYTKIGMRQVAENTVHMNAKQEARFADMNPAQRETAYKFTMYVTEGVFLAAPILGLVFVALFSLVLWGTVNFAFGGKANYSGIFVSWMYAGLPGVFTGLLAIVVIFAGTAPESFNLNNPAPTNIAAFLNPLDTNRALYALLKSLDVITIWFLALLSIGTAIVAGVKRGSGYIAVFGWWIVLVLIGVGITAAMG